MYHHRIFKKKFMDGFHYAVFEVSEKGNPINNRITQWMESPDACIGALYLTAQDCGNHFVDIEEIE